MTEPKSGAFPVPGSLPPKALLTRYAGQRPGRKWVQQGQCAQPLRNNPTLYNHWLYEGGNGKTWDALKTGSEMLWASICGSLLGFWEHYCPWDALLHLKVADVAGLWMATYSIAAWMVLLSVPKSPATPSWQPFYNFSWNSFLFKSYASVV